jgi:arginyl-tRNA synthetase
MNPDAWLREQVVAALGRLGLGDGDFVVESARGHGELTTNAALVLARDTAPVLAARLADELRALPEIAEAVSAGLGFVNVTLVPRCWTDVLASMLATGFADTPKAPGTMSSETLFAIQYAHARCHSVLRHAAEMWPEVVTSNVALARAPLACLTGAAELGLIRQLAGWPSAGSARLAAFLHDVALAFDGWWNEDLGETRLRLLDPGNRELSLARLGLVRAVALAIAAGLVILGIQPMEEMR